MKLTFDFPKLTRGQAVGTSLLCGCASALFVVPSWLSPWADVAPVQVVGGLTLPAAAALLFWSVKGAVDEHDQRRRDELDPSARLGEAQVRMAMAAQTAQATPVSQRPGPVLEGEVVR